VKTRVACTPCSSRHLRASAPGPLLRRGLTHPGISTPSPVSAIVRRSRRYSLSPRSPRVARHGWSSCCSQGFLPFPVLRGPGGGAPGGIEGSRPPLLGGVGVPRVWQSREREGAAPAPSECGYRAFLGQIRRPRARRRAGAGPAAVSMETLWASPGGNGWGDLMWHPGVSSPFCSCLGLDCT
jgi:hypothetical protein